MSEPLNKDSSTDEEIRRFLKGFAALPRTAKKFNTDPDAE